MEYDLEELGYIWNFQKYMKVKKKHEVEFYEVVSAMEDPKGREVFDEASYDEARWIWLGATFAERILVVVYNEDELPYYRIITAFDAEGSWLDEYQG